MPDGWIIIEIALKFVLYVSVLNAAGAAFIRLWFGDIIPDWPQRITLWSGIGAAAAIAVFAVKGVALTGDASGMVSPEILGLLWSTASGDALANRLFGLFLLMFSVLVKSPWTGAIGGILTVGSFTAIGHVASLDLWVFRLVLLVHLICIAVWVGILSPLATLAQTRAPQTYNIGHHFGQKAAYFVPVLIVAGLILAVQITGSITALWATGYGRLLVAKVIGVAVLMFFAAGNKLRMMPQIGQGDPTGYARLRRAIWCEWACIITILVLTACLTTFVALPA